MSATFLRMALLVSLGLCALGILWRVSTWFRVRIGPDARTIPLHRRLSAAVGGAFAALFSRRTPGILKAFVLDVLLQRRLFADSKVRWLGHLFILAGFLLLLVMHGLAKLVTLKVFPAYQATLDPFLFLRNLFGAVTVLGVMMVMGARRHRPASSPIVRRPGDRIFTALLALVLVSGFLLEAQKVASPRAFYRMTKEYLDTTDPEETLPLRTVWAAEYGVAFPDLQGTPDPDKLAEGRELHNDACASCHTRPTSAFVSYPISRAMAPVVETLDEADAERWLNYLHVFACFLGLILLPFTRFFHALADPVSLLANGAASTGPLSPAARATRRALATDACVGCSLCDDRCSVAPIARHLGNPALLPSHKLLATRDLALHPHSLDRVDAHARRVAEGAWLCTTCGRCTERCPVGLDLADMWDAGKGDLAHAGHPAPAQWVQERTALEWADSLGASPGALDVLRDAASPLSAHRETYSACVQCQTCTNVCPVVAHGGEEPGAIDLTPQKVMNLLRLGMVDLALGSRMVWNCATCYQCQEHCPEGIRVTDVMLELRGMAYRSLGQSRERRQPE